MKLNVTTQAHEGIETIRELRALENKLVTTQAHEGIETIADMIYKAMGGCNNSSP